LIDARKECAGWRSRQQYDRAQGVEEVRGYIIRSARQISEQERSLFDPAGSGTRWGNLKDMLRLRRQRESVISTERKRNVNAGLTVPIFHMYGPVHNRMHCIETLIVATLVAARVKCAFYFDMAIGAHAQHKLW
jgi:hypothetical protein